MRPVLAAITLSALVLGLAGCLNGDNSSGRAPEAGGEQPTDNGSSPDPGGDGDDSGDHTDGEEPADNGGDDGTGNGTDDDDTVSNPNTGDQTGPTPGLGPVLELPQLQDARGSMISARSDTLMMTTVHMETTYPGMQNVALAGRCAGSECSYAIPISHEPWVFRAYHALNPDSLGDWSGLGSRHGISLTQLYFNEDLHTGEVDDDEQFITTMWGAWMDHSGFAAKVRYFDDEGESGKYRYAEAVGDLTGSAPTGTATWKGLMVATPSNAGGHGTRVFGDATLEYKLGGTLDATFSGLADMDGGAFHTAVIVFPDLHVDGKGMFMERGRKGGGVHSIYGGLFGPDHIEAAGTFESMNLLGAFGAKKQ